MDIAKLYLDQATEQLQQEIKKKRGSSSQLIHNRKGRERKQIKKLVSGNEIRLCSQRGHLL